jgi:2-polyprenyl-3-methyl-5-hydroxy-6-metoxy-1,4-benzoquinol methylase
MRVAEISCGLGGGAAAYISQFCKSIVAYGVINDYVRLAKRHYSSYPLTYTYVGDYDLIRRKEFFDAIVSLHTLEPVPNDVFFLMAISEALKTGGILTLEVPRLLLKPMGMPLWPFHERECNLTDLRVLLAKTGFKIEDEFGVSRNEYVDIEQTREAMMIICSRQR